MASNMMKYATANCVMCSRARTSWSKREGRTRPSIPVFPPVRMLRRLLLLAAVLSGSGVVVVAVAGFGAGEEDEEELSLLLLSLLVGFAWICWRMLCLRRM